MADRTKDCRPATSASPALAAGERAEQRLAERADDRRGDQVDVARRELAALDALAQRGGEQVGVGAAEHEPLGLDRRVDRLGEQRVGARRLGQRAAGEDLDPGGDPLGRRQLGADARQRVDLALGRAAEDLGDEVGLRGEVAVDRAGRHAGAARDGLHRGGGVAALGEQVERGAHDALAHVGGAGAGAVGGPVGHA